LLGKFSKVYHSDCAGKPFHREETKSAKGINFAKHETLRDLAIFAVKSYRCYAVFQYRTLALAGSARDIHVALPGEMNLAVLRKVKS
jgi:hypothetical protein